MAITELHIVWIEVAVLNLQTFGHILEPLQPA